MAVASASDRPRATWEQSNSREVLPSTEENRQRITSCTRKWVISLSFLTCALENSRSFEQASRSCNRCSSLGSPSQTLVKNMKRSESTFTRRFRRVAATTAAVLCAVASGGAGSASSSCSTQWPVRGRAISSSRWALGALVALPSIRKDFRMFPPLLTGSLANRSSRRTSARCCGNSRLARCSPPTQAAWKRTCWTPTLSRMFTRSIFMICGRPPSSRRTTDLRPLSPRGLSRRYRVVKAGWLHMASSSTKAASAWQLAAVASSTCNVLFKRRASNNNSILLNSGCCSRARVTLTVSTARPAGPGDNPRFARGDRIAARNILLGWEAARVSGARGCRRASAAARAKPPPALWATLR
mmetsp:Transcript_83002/g.189589  ORF Transcript_83002/g.189589 Transcript_83002/m.189589 type:complete len:356 (-) Transcript_83002:1434-2501(-)